MLKKIFYTILIISIISVAGSISATHINGNINQIASNGEIPTLKINLTNNCLKDPMTISYHTDINKTNEINVEPQSSKIIRIAPISLLSTVTLRVGLLSSMHYIHFGIPLFKNGEQNNGLKSIACNLKNSEEWHVEDWVVYNND
jgi:hypothetical protein